MATIALVSGILGLIIWPLAIVAIVTGHLGLSRINHGSAEMGKGSAIAGLVLGWIVVGLFLIFLLIFIISLAAMA